LSFGIAAAQGNSSGSAAGAGGFAAVSAVVARNSTRLVVKDGLEAIPFLGSIVDVGAVVYDLSSANQEYNKCLNGN
jgi:hypothetical protein